MPIIVAKRAGPLFIGAAALLWGSLGPLAKVALDVGMSPIRRRRWCPLMSLISSIVAYLFYAAGLRRMKASTAEVVATLEPVVAAAISWARWRETLPPFPQWAALLVIGGAVMAGPQSSAANLSVS